MAAIIRGALRVVNPRMSQRDDIRALALKSHGRVVDAIERRDARDAEAAALELIDYTAEEMRDFAVDMPERN